MTSGNVKSEGPATETTVRQPRIAVVIPCYRVRSLIGDVLRKIGAKVWRIYCVDDRCPETSREVIEALAIEDPRIHLLLHEENQGVGGAVVTGYRQALADGADVIVKIDGDGQMDPKRIPLIVEPILRRRRPTMSKGTASIIWKGTAIDAAGAAGGQRRPFVPLEMLTGYWNLFDPTNGYTAIHPPWRAPFPCTN